MWACASSHGWPPMIKQYIDLLLRILADILGVHTVLHNLPEIPLLLESLPESLLGSLLDCLLDRLLGIATFESHA